MAFHFERFFANLDDAMAPPAKQRQMAFWDLETQGGLTKDGTDLAVLLSGLEAFTELSEDVEFAVNQVTRMILGGAGVPMALKAIVHYRLALLPVLGSPSALTRMAARKALDLIDEDLPANGSKWLPSPALRASNLVKIFRRTGDQRQVARCEAVPRVRELDRIHVAIDQALFRGDLHVAYALAIEASDSTGDQKSKERREWLHAVFVRDYRSLNEFRAPEAPLASRLIVWLVAVVFPSAGTNTRTVPAPSHLKRGALIDDRSTQLLVKITKLLESYASDRADQSVLLSLEFEKLWRSLPDVELSLIVLLAATQLAKAEGAKDVETYFLDTYRATSTLVSGGKCEDLFAFESIPKGAGSVTTSDRVGAPLPLGRILRGLKLSAATAKLLSSFALAKFQQRLTRDDVKRSVIQATISDAARSFVGDTAQLRGAIQKFAQLGMGVQGDLPFEWRDELARGDTARQPLNEDVLNRILAKVYGDPTSIFQNFELKALACGSIGQVHRATLVSGEKVCVKIRYPGIEAAIKADFRNVRSLLPLVRALLPDQPIKEIAARWEAGMLEECDLSLEAKNQVAAGLALRDLQATVPRVFTALSSPEILVSQYEDAQDFFQFLANSNQAARDKIGVELWRSLYILLRNGQFRVDVQPANYLVQGDRLILLDFGAIVRKEDLEGFKNHFDYMLAIADNDVAAVAKLLVADQWCDTVTADGAARIICEVLGRPFRSEFAFSEAYVQEVYRSMVYGLAKQVKIPVGTELGFRIFWSLFSMLSLLRARANWRAELAAELGDAHSAG